MGEYRCRADEAAGETGDQGGFDFGGCRHPASGGHLRAHAGRAATDAADSADQQGARDPGAVAHGIGRRRTCETLHGLVDAGCEAQCGQYAGAAADRAYEGGAPDISPVDFVSGAVNFLLPCLSAEIDEGSGSRAQSDADRGDFRQRNAGALRRGRRPRGFDSSRGGPARGPPRGFGCRSVGRGLRTAHPYQGDIDGQLCQERDSGENDQQFRVLDIASCRVQLVGHDPAASRRVIEVFGELFVTRCLRFGGLAGDGRLFLAGGLRVLNGDRITGVGGVGVCDRDPPHGLFVAFREVTGAGRHQPIRKLGR
ncbi:hypothetical protein IU448_15830 [Nocardia flavorosea]|uniref:hypothetical protein n=1 Tax=Nocardia flavorosea TaxID=53429 RepID=UPI001894BD3C|nr:hypothetical protein [Nocardia flavorosea]MBF6350473.1 hypothetical protein [Nocardia flavorosea]